MEGKKKTLMVVIEERERNNGDWDFLKRSWDVFGRVSELDARFPIDFGVKCLIDSGYFAQIRIFVNREKKQFFSKLWIGILSSTINENLIFFILDNLFHAYHNFSFLIESKRGRNRVQKGPRSERNGKKIVRKTVFLETLDQDFIFHNQRKFKIFDPI